MTDDIKTTTNEIIEPIEKEIKDAIIKQNETDAEDKKQKEQEKEFENQLNAYKNALNETLKQVMDGDSNGK